MFYDCFGSVKMQKGAKPFMEMRRFAGIPGWGSWLDPEVIRQSGGPLNGEELKIKPEEVLRVIKVMDAAFLSSEKGETVKTNI